MFSKNIHFPLDFHGFMQLWGELVATLLALGGPLWGYLGYMRVTLGHFWASFGPYRRRMAGVMCLGAGLVGLKAKMCTPFEPEAKSRRAWVRQPGKQGSEPDPPPRRLVWRFWEVWRVLVRSLYTPRGQRPRRIS